MAQVDWRPARDVGVAATEELLGAGHPHRPLARRAFEGDRSAALELIARYDAMAPIWTGWVASHAAYYTLPLDRYVADHRLGDTLEISAGTGQAGHMLLAAARTYVAVEPSPAMVTGMDDQLRRHTVLADSSRLPFAAHSFDSVVGLNGLVTGTEAGRVLRPGGTLVLAYSFAEATPVYLDPDDVADVLGWPGWAQRVGPGLVAAFRAPGGPG